MIFTEVNRILDWGIVEGLVFDFSGFTEENALAGFTFWDSKVGVAEQGGPGEKGMIFGIWVADWGSVGIDERRIVLEILGVFLGLEEDEGRSGGFFFWGREGIIGGVIGSEHGLGEHGFNELIIINIGLGVDLNLEINFIIKSNWWWMEWILV
jgi:hypothetical protein